MENEIKLLPCPFCGGKGSLHKTIVFWIECNNCCASAGRSSGWRKIAIKKWNTRHPNLLKG